MVRRTQVNRLSHRAFNPPGRSSNSYNRQRPFRQPASRRSHGDSRRPLIRSVHHSHTKCRVRPIRSRPVTLGVEDIMGEDILAVADAEEEVAVEEEGDKL